MTAALYIVDDEATVRASLNSLLSIAGYPVVRDFASGAAFLEARPKLDPGVILLDYHMAGMNGLDVLSALRGDERFRAIILTGEGHVALAIQAMKAGAFDFLEKPCDPKLMLDAVAAAAARLAEGQDATTRAHAAQAKIDTLSPRERDVLAGLARGQSNKVIAHDLGISPRTIEIYRANIKDKLGVDNLSDMLRIAFAAGL
ncbi:MAG: response regulator [Sphingomonas bacterium]